MQAYMPVFLHSPRQAQAPPQNAPEGVQPAPLDENTKKLKVAKAAVEKYQNRVKFTSYTLMAVGAIGVCVSFWKSLNARHKANMMVNFPHHGKHGKHHGPPPTHEKIEAGTPDYITRDEFELYESLKTMAMIMSFLFFKIIAIGKCGRWIEWGNDSLVTKRVIKKSCFGILCVFVMACLAFNQKSHIKHLKHKISIKHENDKPHLEFEEGEILKVEKHGRGLGADEDDEPMPMLGMNGHGMWNEEFQNKNETAEPYTDLYPEEDPVYDSINRIFQKFQEKFDKIDQFQKKYTGKHLQKPLLSEGGHGQKHHKKHWRSDEADEDDETMPMLGMNGHGQWKEEYQHGPKVESSEDDSEEEEFGGRFHKKGRHGKHGKGGKHGKHGKGGKHGKKGKHGHGGKGKHCGHCKYKAILLVGLIGTHFFFLKSLKDHQMKFEKMTGKEPKGWACGWKNKHGKKQNAVQQQAQQPVQTIPVQPVAYQQVIVTEPTLQYSFHDADSTDQIIEERDKVDSGVTFAPTTIETNKHHMV